MARICQRCNHHNEDHAKFCLSCGGMLEMESEGDSGDPLIGKVLLGRYRPVSLLGEGGMGKVYLSEQKMGTATRKVAIKTLHPELGNDPQLVARFHRESETVIELRHPNNDSVLRLRRARRRHPDHRDGVHRGQSARRCAREGGGRRSGARGEDPDPDLRLASRSARARRRASRLEAGEHPPDQPGRSERLRQGPGLRDREEGRRRGSEPGQADQAGHGARDSAVQ